MGTTDPSIDGMPIPLLLSYAPPARARLRRFLVIPFGLLTTAIALFGVYALERWQDADLMGWHYLYILPVGAVITGAVAGFGYMLAGHIAGLRARRHVFWMIVVLQIFAYFAAQYIEFRSKGIVIEIATGKPIGFIRYFHLMATSMAWMSAGNSAGESLGVTGYLFRFLELAGFVGGGVVLLATLTGGNYCDLCTRYREAKLLTFIPASAPYPAELNDQTRADFEDRSAVLMETAEKRLERLDQCAVDGDLEGFLTELDQCRYESAGAAKLPTRIRIELSYCPSCYDGTLVQSVKMGQDVSPKTTMLPSINLTRDFVASVVKRKKNA